MLTLAAAQTCGSVARGSVANNRLIGKRGRNANHLRLLWQRQLRVVRRFLRGVPSTSFMDLSRQHMFKSCYQVVAHLARMVAIMQQDAQPTWAASGLQPHFLQCLQVLGLGKPVATPQAYKDPARLGELLLGELGDAIR